jgi:NosR/NirI family nitrous oxide reductase transcriptional regulator
VVSWFQTYTKWLHGRWPAGVVEKLPQVDEQYGSNIPGLYIVGDLTGIPLLKFSSHSGAVAVQRIVEEGIAAGGSEAAGVLDVAIVGAGVSGMAAALAARKAGLSFELFEATEPFSTVANFPRGKPIYTYPTDMTPAGDLQFTANVKEPLVEELKVRTLGAGIAPRIARVEQITREDGLFTVHVAGEGAVVARRAIVAIGRSGNFRKLGVPGEELDHVFNRLHDPKDYAGKKVLVVGGGDSALETGIAIALAGGQVTISYRKPEFARPKPENVEKLEALSADPMADVAIDTPVSERVTTSSGQFLEGGRRAGSIRLMMGSQVERIEGDAVAVKDESGESSRFANDAVFSMIGREAPLEFFRRSGVAIRGEMSRWQWLGLGLFATLCTLIYNWKAGGQLTKLFEASGWFPFNIPWLLRAGGGEGLAAMAADPATVVGTVTINLGEPGFYYSLLYSLLVCVFGYRRMQRRRTPYVRAQTISLAAVQVVPLFLLPYILLPYLGYNGLFDAGFGKGVADALFPAVDYGHGREYWRAFGLILAWPLFIWNVFTWQPLWWWLALSVVQTFVIIPIIIYFWGKGAYCGWICSCGALAETLGDRHRHKMPHGASWNKVNMVGQVILAVCLILLVSRVTSWVAPTSSIGAALAELYEGLLYGWSLFGVQLNYKWVVDLLLASIVGYGAYFWFSGRVWCRFACPLAALMHIYARFSRFRILADKKKCISCNVCTSVCHQGIDIMNFANKGLPMADPECVRCSACVESCPTGVLEFGQIDRSTGETIARDKLAASTVRQREVV